MDQNNFQGSERERMRADLYAAIFSGDSRAVVRHFIRA
jgi:hypothetical protein